ncbi:LamG domain-containing protein [Archangium gephyra]|nr:LamG domain-containing protein [Archangium gephyra]
MLREHGVRGGSLGLAEHQSVQVVGAAEHKSGETPRLLDGLEEGSLAVWLRRDAGSGPVGMVLASGGGADPSQVDLGLFINKGRLEFSAARSQWLRPRLLLTPGVFHHIVATWGETGTHLYIGGRLVAHDPQPVRGSRKGQTLWLGKSPEAPAETRSPLVALDDLTLYRGVLPAGAVARLASLEDGNQAVAKDYSPRPPLLADDFSRGLRRWVPLPMTPRWWSRSSRSSRTRATRSSGSPIGLPVAWPTCSATSWLNTGRAGYPERVACGWSST